MEAAVFMLLILVALGLAMTSKGEHMPAVPEAVGKVIQDPHASADDLAAAAKAAEAAGYKKAAGALAERALKKRRGIHAPPPTPFVGLPSPFREVAPEAWTEFVRAMGPGKATTVTPGYHLGIFIMGARRLTDLGLMTAPRKVTWKGKSGVWIGNFVPPLSEEAFLRDPALQYRTFVGSMRAYRNHILSRYRDKIGTEMEGKKATLSGLLAVAHQAGEAGLAKWLEGGRGRFPQTTGLYLKTTGLF